MEYWLIVIGKPVPNVPCGVERNNAKIKKRTNKEFLMYRVELKGRRSA